MFPAWIARIKTRLAIVNEEREKARRVDRYIGSKIRIACSEMKRSTEMSLAFYGDYSDKVLTIVVNRYEKRGYKVSLVKVEEKEMILFEW